MRVRSLICLVLALALAGALPAMAQTKKKRPVKIEGMKVLPLRVLTRPFANIYQSSDEASPTVQENLPAFQPFYVYTQPGLEERAGEMGWYEVGSDVRGNILGWMKTKDVFEWKQTMCLAYTHPDGRKPVLLFDQRDSLLGLLQKAPEARSFSAQELYSAISSKQIADGFPVKSIEPEKAVDISKQFYLLPILNHEAIELEGREGRLLRVAAVTKAGPKARESSDIRENPEYLEESQEAPTQATQEVLKRLSVELVFVIDTTVSMKPYIAATLDVVRDVAQNLADNPDVAEGVRLGLWGYRDSVNDIPGIGYTTKNYTPQLQGIDEFQATLATMQVTKVDSKDWPEDVFSGVSEAMNSTPWNPDAIRIVVLMGDAAGHEAGHPWNLSGHTPETLRAMADDASLYIYALHIKPERAVKHQAPAEEHFRALSQNPGADEPAYVPVMSSDLDGFSNATRQLTDAVVVLVAAAKSASSGGELPASSQSGAGGQATGSQRSSGVDSADDPFAQPLDQPADSTRSSGVAQSDADDPFAMNTGEDAGTETPSVAAGDSQGELAGLEPLKDAAQDPARAKANQVVRAALVEWIGSQTQAMPPRDVVAWVVDKDLINPAVSSLEVRLLVNKRQLDSMRTVLNDVMAAGVRGQLGGEDFFSALQATAAVAARDPDRIKNARTMAQTGLIPEFLLNLPYRSRLMEMSNDLWASWSVDEQDEFINELKAKIEAYEDIHNRPEGWVELNQGDDPDEHVYPVSLELLP